MALTPPLTQKKRLARCNGDSLRESWREDDAGSEWPAKPRASWEVTRLKRAVLFPGRSSAGKRLIHESRPSGHVNASFLFGGPAVSCLSTNVPLYNVPLYVWNGMTRLAARRSLFVDPSSRLPALGSWLSALTQGSRISTTALADPPGVGPPARTYRRP